MGGALASPPWVHRRLGTIHAANFLSHFLVDIFQPLLEREAGGGGGGRGSSAPISQRRADVGLRGGQSCSGPAMFLHGSVFSFRPNFSILENNFLNFNSGNAIWGLGILGRCVSGKATAHWCLGERT